MFPPAACAAKALADVSSNSMPPIRRPPQASQEAAAKNALSSASSQTDAKLVGLQAQLAAAKAELVQYEGVAAEEQSGRTLDGLRAELAAAREELVLYEGREAAERAER